MEDQRRERVYVDTITQSLAPRFKKTPWPTRSVYRFGLLLPPLETIVRTAVAVGFRVHFSCLS